MIKPAAPQDTADTDTPQALISPDDFQALGCKKFGYVRRYTVKGQDAFVLHAADGAALAMHKNLDDARHAAGRQALRIVSLH